MSKTIPNEVIIAALLEQGTIKGAAAVAGVSTRTIYDRLTENEFKAEYKAAKAAITRQAVCNINSRIAEAINAVGDIVKDTTVNPATRIQAAQLILNSAVKFGERLQAEEQSADSEKKSPFDIF